MPNTLISSISKRAIFIVAPFVFFAACEKPTDELGFNQVIGGTIAGDTIHIPVVSYTRKVDSILVALAYQNQLSLGGYSSTRLMGQNTSTYLGQSNANMIAEILPLQVNPNFGANPVVDSVNFYLRMTDSYGDTTQPMTITVHELAENISKDSIYFSNFKPVLGQQLGTLENYYPQPNTPVSYEGFPEFPVLKIPLDQNYFQTRFADVGNGSFEPFSTFPNFLEYFKGLHIAATSGNTVLTLNLASNYSTLRIHYHNNTDTSLVELDFNAGRSQVPITFSTFEHDYNMGLLDLANQDSLLGENQTYIQAMGGVATAIKLNPAVIDSLENRGLIINRALLQVNTAVGTGESVAPSPSMEIREFLAGGIGSRSLDFQDNSGDGQLRLGVLRNNRYNFDLTRELFNILNSGENNTLAIVPVSRTTAANRTILQGSSATGQQAKLIVYYTQP